MSGAVHLYRATPSGWQGMANTVLPTDPGNGGNPTPPTGGTGTWPTGFIKPGTLVNGALTVGLPAGTDVASLKVLGGADSKGRITITTPGTILDGYIIHGLLVIKAKNCVVRNSIVAGAPGATSATGLIDCRDPACENFLVELTDLVPDQNVISWTMDGVIGSNYTARKVNVYHVVDGFGVYNGTDPDNSVVIDTVWVHDLTYIAPDPEQTKDNHTHNDGVQIQGGGNVLVTHSNIQALVAPPPYSNATSGYAPSVTGQAIAATGNTLPIDDFSIIENWLDGGAQSITMVDNTQGFGPKPITVARNLFGRNQPSIAKDWTTVHARRPVIISPNATMQAGFPSSTSTSGAQDTSQGNVYEDDNSKITVFRQAS